MGKHTLAVAIIMLSVLGTGLSSAQDVQILEAYEQYKAMSELNEAERLEGQLDLLQASLDAKDKSMEFMDSAAQAFERGASTGIVLLPDGLFKLRLEKLWEETEEASERLAETWPAKGMSTMSAARKYHGKLTEADAALSAILHDPNLPPDAAQGLAALRGIGMVLETLGDVPLVGDALSQYGELTAGFTEALRKDYRLLAPGGQEGALLNSYSTDLRRGFPGVVPTETQVLRATRWKVPLLRDGNGKNAPFYLKVEGTWKKVDGPRIASIVSDWLVVFGQPETSLLDEGVDSMKKMFDRVQGQAAVAADWSYPSSSDLLAMSEDVSKTIHGVGLSRKGLRKEAEKRLALLADEREMRQVLLGIPAFENERITVEDYHDTKANLRAMALRLGVPLSSERQRNLMRDLYLDESLVWRALRELAFRLQPGGEDFVRGLDLDPRSMDLFELAVLLQEYREGRATVPVQVEVREAVSGQSIPGVSITSMRTLGSGLGPQGGPLAKAEAVTDANGIATMQVLRGHHLLSAVATGFEGGLPARRVAFAEAQPHSATLTLTAPLPASAPLLFEEDRGMLVATVRDRETRGAIAGARVSLSQGAQSLDAATGGDGLARIEDIPFGVWSITVEADGYQSRSRDGFEFDSDNPERKGTVYLPREEPETRPASIPAAPAPKSDPGQCGFQTIAEWDGEMTDLVNEGVSKASEAVGGSGQPLEVPGPGLLRVHVRTSGKHERANDVYGNARYRSRVVFRSGPEVMGTESMLGGRFFPGVTDVGQNTKYFSAKGGGTVSVQFIPESCSIRSTPDGLKCWSLATTKVPGIKLLNTSYQMSIQFDPCRN